jgi:hypothetical protein
MMTSEKFHSQETYEDILKILYQKYCLLLSTINPYSQKIIHRDVLHKSETNNVDDVLPDCTLYLY